MKGRPPVPHPLDLALRVRFAREAGIDPERLAAWLEWREAAPREMVDRLVAAFFPVVPPDAFLVEEPLPPRRDDATIATQMLQSPHDTVPGVKPTRHPFSEALRKRGISLAEWAKDHGVSASYARSWIQKGAGARPIPKKFATLIAVEFGIPLSAWKNGLAK